MKSKKKQLIREIQVCGVTFPVYRASVEEVPDLVQDGELLDGFCDFERGCIYIREGLSPSLERDAVAHEVGHAFLCCSGLQEILRDRIGAKKFKGFEELLVRVATPHISHFFGLGSGPRLAKTKAARIATKRSGGRVR